MKHTNCLRILYSFGWKLSFFFFCTPFFSLFLDEKNKNFVEMFLYSPFSLSLILIHIHILQLACSFFLFLNQSLWSDTSDLNCNTVNQKVLLKHALSCFYVRENSWEFLIWPKFRLLLHFIYKLHFYDLNTSSFLLRVLIVYIVVLGVFLFSSLPFNRKLTEQKKFVQLKAVDGIL